MSLVSDRLGNATLGRLETTLSRTEQGYAALNTTKAQGMAAIIMGSNFEESCEFSVEQGRAVSKQYSGGRKDSNDYQVEFDWDNRKVSFSDGESLDMPQGYVVDNCILPFAAALLRGEGLSDQILYVVDGKKKRIRGYRLKSTSEETLETKFGDVDTLKVVLEREFKPERTFTFWLSPGNNFMPLKMEEKRRSRTTTMLVDNIEES